MQNLITFNKTMPLKEITDLLNTRHNDAMRTVTMMSKSIEFGTLRPARIVYNSKGQKIDTYLLDKRQSLAVAARLNDTLLMRIIDRWQELEAKQEPLTRLELAKEQVRMIEELEAKEAEVLSLKVELDEAHHWATIKRVEAETGQTFNWRVLKAHMRDGERRDIFDANYTTVKSYSADLWMRAYNMDISTMKTAAAQITDQD